jgi:choline transport protein
MAGYELISGSLTNLWAAYLSILGQGLIYRGPQGVIFSLLVTVFMQWTITLGLSELASAFPSSGVSSAT